MKKQDNYKNILIAKTVDGKSVNIGTVENRCLCCGEVIPEGREVCIQCERSL